LCSNAFLKREHLVIHQRLHTGEQPFICNICSKSFPRKGSLLKHLRLHPN
jgi:KRAB domain-containing zinc finger protein